MKALPPVHPLRSVVYNHIKDDLWPLLSRDDLSAEASVSLYKYTKHYGKERALWC